MSGTGIPDSLVIPFFTLVKIMRNAFPIFILDNSQKLEVKIFKAKYFMYFQRIFNAYEVPFSTQECLKVCRFLFNQLIRPST